MPNTTEQTQKGQVLRLIRQNGGEMRRGEILDEIDFGESRLDNLLGELVDSGELEKPSRGLYTLGATSHNGNANSEDSLSGSHLKSEGLAQLFRRQTDMIIHTEARVAADNGRVVYPDDATQEVSVPRGALSRLLGIRPPREVYVMEAEGDSMKPTIRDGDLVISEPVERVRSAGVYVTWLEHGVAVKRLQPLPDGSIRIISDNTGKDYINCTMIPTEDAFRLKETGESARMYPVGRVLFPDRNTEEIHVQQVGSIIRSVMQGDSGSLPQLTN